MTKSKSKFKVGDKVKIILKDGSFWKEDIRELVGKIVTIKECCDNWTGYKILEDNGRYRWNDCDFELIEEEENNMMRYKVGDRVVIREDLEWKKRYGGLWFNSVMEMYLGRVSTITDIVHDGGYILDVDVRYVFNDEMIDHQATEELNKKEENKMKAKYNIGDRVVIRGDLEVNEDYGGLYFDEDMCDYMGETLTITDVDHQGDYTIKGCKEFYFNDEMIDHLLTKELQHAEVIQKHIFDKLSITKDDFQKEDEIFVYGIDENGYYKKLSFSDIAYGKVAVRCDTLEKSKEYLQFLESFDIKWVTSDKKPTELCYYDNPQDGICYIVNVNDLSYIDLSDALELDLKIYDYVANSNAVNNEEGKECNAFNKSDLKSGHVIRTRDGYLYIFMKNEFGGLDYAFNQKTKGHMELTSYNEDLTLNDEDGDEEFDIIEVYEPLDNYALKCVAERTFDTSNDLDEYFKLVYKREDPKEMTLREIEEQLGYKIKLI